VDFLELFQKIKAVMISLKFEVNKNSFEVDSKLLTFFSSESEKRASSPRLRTW